MAPPLRGYQSTILREHHEDAAAKRVVTVAGGGRSIAYEDTNFIAGDSPVVLSINTDLGKNGDKGFIANDGPGNFTIEISDNGTNYGSLHTLKTGETLNFDD